MATATHDLIPSFDLPPITRIDGDFDDAVFRDGHGNMFVSLGDDNEEGVEFFRKLDDDEAHEIEMGQWTDYDRRADYADRECAA